MLRLVAADGTTREVSARLAAQTEALAALGAWLHLRSTGTTAVPDVERALEEVVSALGLTEALAAASASELAAALSPVRAVFLQAVDLLSDPARAPGWSYTDADVLQSQGQASAAFAGVIRHVVAPALPGLGERLAAHDAAFLDVGVGVGALAVAMSREWPAMRVVGIDTWDVALSIARRNVADAGLEGRIELRQTPVEELVESRAFDLVWLPGPFLPRNVLVAALGRVREALRPGGWVILALDGGQDELSVALGRLRAVRSGGVALDADEALSLLAESGLVEASAITAQIGLPSLLVAGRRAP